MKRLIRRLLAQHASVQPSSVSRRSRPMPAPLRLESLEERLLLHGDEGDPEPPDDDDLLSGAIVVRDGKLEIRGTADDDTIDVALVATSEIEVTLNDAEPRTFALADVDMLAIRCGAGNDVVTIDPAIDILIHGRAGRGDDELNAGNGSATMRGGRGDDLLVGGDSDDMLMGGRGDDTGEGGDGDDRLYGGGRHSGHDHHHSPDGDDMLLGGDGDDQVRGGNGADQMDGEDGADMLKGGRGPDTFAPDDGEDERRDFNAAKDEEGDGGGDEDINNRPTANAQNVAVALNTAKPITLTGDDGDTGVTQALSFRVQTLPPNGTLRDSTSAVVTVGTTLPSANLTYTPNTGFTGSDSFTFIVMDNGGTQNGGLDTSNPATVSITVSVTNPPFGAVTPGPFDDPSLLGTRTDLVSGAPAITQDHVSTAVNYSGYSNPPTYGPHHGVVRDSSNEFITPRRTGVYTTAQPDEDLVHNLEHGHVWISYNPTLLSNADKIALEQLVNDGGTNTGVILTPRAANDSAIALASWAHLLKLNSFDATQIRNFVETNRGHSPEGFIPSGQKSTSSSSETLDDGLLHTGVAIAPFAAVTPGSENTPGLRGTRTDMLPGAPAVSQVHVTTAVDYTGHTNPPSYGAHHGVVRDAQNNFITPRPTGVYTTEQPDEDLVHNLEHGLVWVSYNPTLLSATDRQALETFINAGGTNAGVILTPRSNNAAGITLTSWTRQLTLTTFNSVTIRDFIETNRGKSPEGYIPSGQRDANSETLNDGLPHTP